MTDKTVADVKAFWESNPLFSGESRFPVGSREYFEEHRDVVVKDCFAGEMDERIFPSPGNDDRVLDLGCGPGVWTVELARRGSAHVTAADLTEQGLSLTRARAQIYELEISTSQQNAEQLSFDDSSFSHVNCQGVIHHTPDTEACVREIARVLRRDGTAMISVYYKNVFLRLWPVAKYLGKALSLLGAGLKSRGRDSIYDIDDADEIVRVYDGDRNPIGKAYSRDAFVAMLEPFFQVDETFLHFFPARSLPFPVPGWLHRMLDRSVGLMIYARCTKRTAASSSLD